MFLGELNRNVNSTEQNSQLILFTSRLFLEHKAKRKYPSILLHDLLQKDFYTASEQLVP